MWAKGPGRRQRLGKRMNGKDLWEEVERSGSRQRRRENRSRGRDLIYDEELGGGWRGTRNRKSGREWIGVGGSDSKASAYN